MTRNLKVLVLALVAVLALTALGASSASAFTKFKAATGTTSFKGPQKGTAKFVTNPGTIECTGGTFRGMVTSGSEPETVQTSDSTAAEEPEKGKKGIEYTGCKFLGAINVAVNPNGCQYQFHAATGKVDIINGGGTCATEGITFEGAGCKVHVRPIAANQGLSGVTFTNVTANSVKVQPNPVSGITYTAEGCLFGGNGTFANGVYGDGSVAESSSVLVEGTTNTSSTMAASGISVV